MKKSFIEWVSVEDRLPDEHQDVIVYFCYRSKEYLNLRFMKQTSFYNDEFECIEEVTHWGELPNFPGESE